ncbi:MAG: hypothetical protein KAV87_51885 [Desulfobacteraceae bacterium]|nr:hypothetical protein [Desulfobacteraceae bacterium]
MKIQVPGTSPSTETMKNQFVESVGTSGSTPEEMLDQLDSYGIEWHLTEEGDLWIKYWQVGAEKFVPAEYVAKLQGNRTVNNETTALEWMSKQLPELEKEYSGKWIAVVDNQVAAASDNLPDLLQQVQKLAIEHPFITEIPARPLIWATAYAYQGI